MFLWNMNTLLNGGLKATPDLVGDRVLKARAVARIYGTDAFRLVARQQSVKLGNDVIELALGVSKAFLPLLFHLFPAPGTAPAPGRPAQKYQWQSAVKWRPNRAHAVRGAQMSR
jgi:hypothetical protein